MAVVSCRGLFWAAVTERGGLLVSGNNEEGQLGIGTLDHHWDVALLGGHGPVEGDEVADVIGGMHALALADELAPHVGALALRVGADGSTFDGRVVMVTTGDRYTLCVTDAGVVWAFGSNEYGQAGMGALVERSAVPVRWPAQACGGAPVLMVACGPSHTLVLTRAGEVWACGLEYFEHLDDDYPTPVFTPARARVPGLADIVHVCAGAEVSGALDAAGVVWTWGYKYYGQLGYSAPEESNYVHTPRSLAPAAFGGSAVALLTMGFRHATAVTARGELWVWGNGSHGCLGLGSNARVYVPTMLEGGGAPAWGGVRVRMAAEGCCHTVILLEDGAVWACGRGELGAVGDGGLTERSVPVPLPQSAFGGARVVFVAGGCLNSMALTAEGILYAWGSFACGNPERRTFAAPVPVAASFPPGARVGRGCGLPRRHSLAFCMGMHWNLGGGAPPCPYHSVEKELLAEIVHQCAVPEGAHAGMPEALLTQLAVRERVM